MARLNFDIFFRDHGARRGIGDLGDETDRTRERMDRFRGAAVVGATLAAGAIIKFGASSVKAYTEAEASQNKLQDAFDKFPRLADTNIGALQELNSELSKKVKYDDDATASGQAVLAGFQLTGQQITQLTPLLQDYASKTGKDLPTAARDLGKATMGSGMALKKIGIDFKDAGSQSANFDQVMGGLRKQVGGFAESEGRTAAGQAVILENQFGEIQETVGEKLLPALLALGRGLLAIIGFISDNSNVIIPLVGGIALLATTIWAVNAATAAWAATTAAATTVLQTFGFTTAQATAGLIRLRTAMIAASGPAVALGVAIAAVWAGGKIGEWQVGVVSVEKLTEAMKKNAGQSKLSSAELEIFKQKGLLGFRERTLNSAEALDKFGISAYNALDQGWNARLGRWQSFGSAESEFRKQTEQLDAAFARMVSEGNVDGAAAQIKLYEDAAVKAGVPLASLRAAFPAYAKAVKNASEESSRLTAETGKSTSSTDNNAEAIRRQKRAVAASTEALRVHANALLKNRGSENEFEAAIDDASKALRENRATLNKHTEAGRANRIALDRIASSTLAWRDAAKEAGKSQKQQTAITQNGRAELIRMGQRFGMTRTAARKYADEVLGIPKRVGSTITLGLKNNIPKSIFGINVGGYGQGLGVLRRARGGKVWGSGSETSDSIPAMLSHNEHVWTAKEVHAAGGHSAVEGMRKGVLRGYAKGGSVFGGPRLASALVAITAGTTSQLAKRIEQIATQAVGYNPGLNGALAFARRQVGKPYIWGGVGPRGYDCSGFLSALLNVAQGRTPYSRRFATGSFPSAGFVRGTGSFMIGSRRGNPGHMAGTINGVNVESAGSTGPNVGRSARGARHPMFAGVYRLKGYARGGQVGDAPFDFLNPYGREYLGDEIRKTLLMDRGGILPNGATAVNRSGQPERMLSGSQTRNFENLTKVLDRRMAGGGNQGHVPEIDYDKLGNALIRSMKNVTVEMDGRAVGRFIGVQSNRLVRGN